MYTCSQIVSIFLQLTDMDNLVKLVEDLKIAVDGKKGDHVPSLLDTVLSQIESGEKG